MSGLLSRVAVMESQIKDINTKIDDDRKTASDSRQYMENKLDKIYDRFDKLFRMAWLAVGALAAIQFILKYGPELKKITP